MFRLVQHSDIPKIQHIYAKHHMESFGLFNTNGNLASGVYENGGEVIAYGMIKQLAEAILVMDLDLSARKRVKALLNLIQFAINKSKEADLQQLHAFVKDERFANILRKDFGFVDVRDVPLVLNL